MKCGITVRIPWMILFYYDFINKRRKVVYRCETCVFTVFSFSIVRKVCLEKSG